MSEPVALTWLIGAAVLIVSRAVGDRLPGTKALPRFFPAITVAQNLLARAPLARVESVPCPAALAEGEAGALALASAAGRAVSIDTADVPAHEAATTQPDDRRDPGVPRAARGGPLGA